MGVTEDRELFRLEAPWPLPDLLMVVVKSGQRHRWTVLFRLRTAEGTDGAYWADYTWWLQLRCWWPPVAFFRGWMKRGL